VGRTLLIMQQGGKTPAEQFDTFLCMTKLIARGATVGFVASRRLCQDEAGWSDEKSETCGYVSGYAGSTGIIECRRASGKFSVLSEEDWCGLSRGGCTIEGAPMHCRAYLPRHCASQDELGPGQATVRACGTAAGESSH